MSAPSANPAAPPHYWHGNLDVGFVFSVPGTYEAENDKPLYDASGRNLDHALERHLSVTLPTIFRSADRYDYRITNAFDVPISLALGHGRTEATACQILDKSNVDRVIRELVGVHLVVLCGNKAKLLKRVLNGRPLVLTSHTSMAGLNSRWSGKKLGAEWQNRLGPDLTAERLRRWALDVQQQVEILQATGKDMEAAYVLELDSAAKTALRSLRDRLDERTKVRVKNTVAPHDSVVVDAWWSVEQGERLFNYMDGPLGTVVQFGPEYADILLATP